MRLTNFACIAGWLVGYVGLVNCFSTVHLLNRQVRCLLRPASRMLKSSRMATTIESFDILNNTITNNRIETFNTEMELKEESMEMVEAILAASGDAVTMAEASLPAEVLEELNINSILEANHTEFSSLSGLDETPKNLPASQVVGEPLLSPVIEAPSIMKIMRFAVPAMGVWLCSPLLSMIDTSAVGILSGTINQAALNPAVAVTDYAALCIAFLYAATTNMVASARELERTVAGKPKTTKAFFGAMQLSTYVGAGLGSILFVFARQLLSAIMGTNAVDPAVFASAMKYVRIRSLGMPAAAIIGSAQAACLGLQDVSSPLYVLLAAATVNFVGDMTFVGCSNPLIGGAAGAAWATVFSQYAAVALFMRWLCFKSKPRKPVVMDLTKSIMELVEPSIEGPGRWKKFRETLLTRLRSEQRVKTGTAGKTLSASGKPSVRLSKFLWRKNDASAIKVTRDKRESLSVKGLLANRASSRDLIKFPSRTLVKQFAPYVLPVTMTQVGRVSGYVAMSHVVSTTLGTLSMAAQQILLSFFYCLCPICDALNLSGQSFIPVIFEKKLSKERARALEKTTRRLLKAGLAFGIVTSGIVALIPLLNRFFTSDPAVVALVNTSAPYLAMFFSVHGVVCSSEGLLLGQKDLGFLGKMYSIFCIAVPYFMLRVKRAGLSGARAVTLNSIWKVFVSYQFFRGATWVCRIVRLQMKVNQEARELEKPF